MATQNLPRPAPGGRQDANLGITQTIAPPTPGWTGELRVRFTDFQVNEISKDGTVVHLKETKLPSSDRSVNGALTGDAPPPKANDEKPVETPAEEETPEAPEVSEEDKKTLADLTNDTFATELITIYQAAVTKKTIPSPARSPAIDDKDVRSQIHQQVRRIFRSVIDTTTDQNEAGSFIIGTGRPPRPNKAYNQKHRTAGGGGGRSNNNNNRRGNKTGRLVVTGEGDFLHFTVYKENRDTMDASHQLARVLRTKPQVFAFAGTKDRRAATAQRFSVRGLKAEAVLGANPRMHGVVTGDFVYARSPLYLGALQGNQFAITLKKCELADDASLGPEPREAAIRARAEAALASMASRGWINYYGHQRFGTLAVGTHDVGRLILQSDYEGAANAVLAYDPAVAQRAVDGEEPAEAHRRDELNRARACMIFLQGGSADDALHFLPRRFTGEASLIRHLGRPSAKDGSDTLRRDFQGALLTVPRPLRNMFLHAYQSYIWNHAASHRWSQHGDTVVEGDLVLDGTAEEDGPDDEDNASTASRDASAARPLTAKEASSGRYTIHDIVLPTPGHSVIYPSNDTGEFYTTFMGLPENGALDPKDMSRRQRDFSLPGNYRRLTARFIGTEPPRVEVRRYARDDEQMHPTDLDRLRQAVRDAQATAGAKRKRPEEEAEGEAKSEEADAKRAKTEEPEAKTEAAVADDKMEVDAGVSAPEVPVTTEDDAAKDKVAVVVHFQLAKSAYATVALRELMGTQAEAEA
ncbi:tRNA pseudouridine synthase D [Plectosphaerella plurivora]|uniref:tRNA pseudouridine synthase D n=1 Tax=Plectosphaerella plurivora TaxID=936078 RepID=A0A9P8VJQ7_9PEZI|nr:tRNA pseudouridine synthase D [Plectosphaerella plurivora]